MIEDDNWRGSVSFDKITINSFKESADIAKQEDHSYFICQTTIDQEDHDMEGFSVTMRVFINKLPVTLYFTKKQANVLADFLQLAKHAEEPG